MPLLIAGCAYGTYVSALRFHRMRDWWNSRLRLEPMPARTGGALNGIFLVHGLRADDTYRATLECTKSEFIPFDFDSTSRHVVLWTHSVENRLKTH